MTQNPDNNPDILSGLTGWSGQRTGIPTIIPTNCRDSEGLSPEHFVRPGGSLAVK